MKQLRINIRNGKFANKDFILEQISTLENGSYNLFIEDVAVGQRKYFAYRDIIADYLGYNTTKEKKELHDYIKGKLLIKIFGNPNNLNTEDYTNLSVSTKHLSDLGWWNLNKSLEIFAMSEWGVLLQ